jgi:hypothetical protein
VGVGSLGLREVEGEGGEDFDVAQTGRRADLLASPGFEGKSDVGSVGLVNWDNREGERGLIRCRSPEGRSKSALRGMAEK